MVPGPLLGKIDAAPGRLKLLLPGTVVEDKVMGHSEVELHANQIGQKSA